MKQRNNNKTQRSKHHISESGSFLPTYVYGLRFVCRSTSSLRFKQLNSFVLNATKSNQTDKQAKTELNDSTDK